MVAIACLLVVSIVHLLVATIVLLRVVTIVQIRMTSIARLREATILRLMGVIIVKHRATITLIHPHTNLRLELARYRLFRLIGVPSALEFKRDKIRLVDFPDFSRHLIMSKKEWSKSNEKCPLYSRI